MASEKQIEANRRNARRSTGPRTPGGKQNVRLNALKHGLTAATVVLDGEDPEVLEARVADWKDDLQPGTALEQYLVERAAHNSWQLDRADRAIAARINTRMREVVLDQLSDEAEEVARLGYLLFRDPQGPLALYPHDHAALHTRVSWSHEPEPGHDPAALLARLESSAAGCRWLLLRWGELKAILADGRLWQPPDRFRAARLLGLQPIDALDDDRVMTIHLACRAMDPTGPPPFADLAHEMSEKDEQAYRRRAEARGAKARTPANPAAGKAALLDLIDAAVGRLEDRVADHHRREAAERAAAPAALAFDDSPEGELLRRYQLSHGRGLFRTINAFFKVRKELAADPAGPEIGPDADPIAGPSDETKPIPAFDPATRHLGEEHGRLADETKPISEESPTTAVPPEDRRQEPPDVRPEERPAIDPAGPDPATPSIGGDRGEAAIAGSAMPPAAEPQDAEEPDGPEDEGFEDVDWAAEQERVIESLVEQITSRFNHPSLMDRIMGREADRSASPRDPPPKRAASRRRR